MEEIKKIFDRQRQNRWRVSQTGATERIEKLKKLRDAVLKRRSELQESIHADFRKHPTETDLTEIFPVVAELNHTLKHLRHWMKPKKVPTPLVLFGTRSEIRYEARGMVLVLAPWNYPFGLSVNPVVAALSAGNCVCLKPSSKVPHTSRFLKSLFADLFDEAEVAVIEGDHAVSDALLELPFDHIFFTGSPRIGMRVMAAAARNLATVTLELGGKSPVIVDETADIQKAAERICWAKFINAGQTCVAPDYLLIHESKKEEFLENARKIISSRFGETEAARATNENFCRLVSPEHLQGLKGILDESVRAGAKIEVGGGSDAENRYLAPTLVSNIQPDSPLMREEIFGPILPVLPFRSLDEAIALIQSKPKPLALYVFSQSPSATERILSQTSAGGTCVGSLIVHLANTHLPFGGVGTSGMGNYHGWFGFRNLSHERAVLRQGRLDILRFFYPPYTGWVKKLADFVLKFFA